MTPCLKLDSTAFVADPELIEALERHSAPLVCDEDRILFHQDEVPCGLYILHKGDVTLTMKSPSGQVVLCIQPSVGSLLGLPALVGNERYSLTAEGQQGAEFSFIARKAFDDLMQSDSSLPFRVLQVLAAEVRAARQLLL